MKTYTKPTIEVIVTSPMVLFGMSEGEGGPEEFGNQSTFEENSLGLDVEDIKGNLWNKD